MLDPCQEIMNKLSESCHLCHETYLKVAAKMAISSAVELGQKKQNLLKKQDQEQLIRPHDLPKMNRPPVRSPSAQMSSIIDLGKFKPKKDTDNYNSKSCDVGLSSAPPAFDKDEDSATQDEKQDKCSIASFYASTCIGSKTDMTFASVNKKEHQVIQRLSGKKLNSLDEAMKTMAYHMGRVSFECECHFQDIPLSSMSKADRRHCRRFHKGLIGRKKVGEKRSATS